MLPLFLVAHIVFADNATDYETKETMKIASSIFVAIACIFQVTDARLGGDEGRDDGREVSPENTGPDHLQEGQLV